VGGHPNLSSENLTLVSLACAVRASTIRVPEIPPTGLAPSSMCPRILDPLETGCHVAASVLRASRRRRPTYSVSRSDSFSLAPAKRLAASSIEDPRPATISTIAASVAPSIRAASASVSAASSAAGMGGVPEGVPARTRSKSIDQRVEGVAVGVGGAIMLKVVKSSVASPYNHGLDRVDRVIDTIDVMYRRRQLDGQQKNLERYGEVLHRVALVEASNGAKRAFAAVIAIEEVAPIFLGMVASVGRADTVHTVDGISALAIRHHGRARGRPQGERPCQLFLSGRPKMKATLSISQPL
jgi:hypothetical protein